MYFIHKQYGIQNVNSVNLPVFDVQQFLVDKSLNVTVKAFVKIMHR